MTTMVQKVCRMCGYKAKRKLLDSVGVRGTHETASELALCPNGHGPLEREDGAIERDGVVVGHQ